MNKKNDIPNIKFSKRNSIHEVEEGRLLAPKFDTNKLIPVVTTDYNTGEVLMLGYMNEEAFKRTLLLREAVYYSRSRDKIWHKGAKSGFAQKVKEMRIDDDQDSIWLRVELKGASCHVGYRSCFFRSISLKPIKLTKKHEVVLDFEEKEKIFDPEEVYRDEPNPTKL